MKHTEIKKFLQVCEDANVVPYLWGNQGIGKSQLIHEYCAEKNIGVIDLRLSLMEPGDLLGMPVIEDDKTVFKKPSWFPEEGTTGVLFLDELNRANEDILQATFQLVLDRKINQHHLPDGWTIVCAGNYGEQFDILDLDPALMDRFCHIKVDVLYDEWLSWAERNNINEEVRRIVQEHQILYDDAEEMKFTIESLGIETTPRGWELLSKIVNNTNNKNFICEAAKGILAPEDAALFIKTFNNKNYIHFTKQDVYTLNKKKINKVLKHEQVMELCANVNNEILKDMKEESVDKEELTNFAKYLLLIPDDAVNGVMKKIVENDTLSSSISNISDTGVLEKITERITNVS